MRKLLLTGIVIISSSCASLTVGHENFRCEGTDKGGICAPTHYVYQHRKEIMKEQKPEINGQKIANKLYQEYKKIELKDLTLYRPAGAPQKPVRLEEQIQRIYIFPYQTKDGNLIEGHYIYTVVKPARWLYFTEAPLMRVQQVKSPKSQELLKPSKYDKVIGSYLHEKEAAKHK
jgi:type IV conjugative transfer system lipoprotein TraV